MHFSHLEFGKEEEKLYSLWYFIGGAKYFIPAVCTETVAGKFLTGDKNREN